MHILSKMFKICAVEAKDRYEVFAQSDDIVI